MEKLRLAPDFKDLLQLFNSKLVEYLPDGGYLACQHELSADYLVLVLGRALCYARIYTCVYYRAPELLCGDLCAAVRRASASRRRDRA
jgi:hypothetical protein